jgi:hypothetical protein
VLRAALSSSETTRVLAAPPPAMRLATLCVASSGRGAALLLAPSAPAVRDAESATGCSQLAAALKRTQPMRHGAPPGSRGLPLKTPSPLRRASHSRHPPPLSPQRSASAHQTRDGGRARAGQAFWVQHVPTRDVNSAWAGDVRWARSRGGWSGTPPQPPRPGSWAACSAVPPWPPLTSSTNTPHSPRTPTPTALRRDTSEGTR